MKKTSIILLTLFLISVIEASAVSAELQSAETGPYDSINGKKLLFYGDNITSISITWYDASNTSYSNTSTSTGLSVKSYLFTITNIFDASYILWDATITNSSSVQFYFKGGFSTQTISISQITVLINSLLTNPLLDTKFTTTQNTIITSLDTKISTYNDGLISRLESIGLTSEQSSQIATSVTEGVNSALKTKDQQDIMLKAQYNKGYGDAWKLIILVIVVLAVILIILATIKGWLHFSNIRIRRRKKVESPSEGTFNLDTFSLD